MQSDGLWHRRLLRPQSVLHWPTREPRRRQAQIRLKLSLASALTSCAFARVPSRPFDIAQTMQEAIALHQQGRLREAEKLYARVLKVAPESFDALHMCGLAKAQGGEMGEDYRLISAALKINDRAPDALMNLAHVLHALKRDAEDLDCLDKALALRPG